MELLDCQSKQGSGVGSEPYMIASKNRLQDVVWQFCKFCLRSLSGIFNRRFWLALQPVPTCWEMLHDQKLTASEHVRKHIAEQSAQLPLVL